MWCGEVGLCVEAESRPFSDVYCGHRATIMWFGGVCTLVQSFPCTYVSMRRQLTASHWTSWMLVPQSNSSEEPVKDHCNLEVLNAATLVENTKQRFTRDWIYTYISEILIAVNPFKYIDGLYTDEKKAMYKGVNWTTLEPHVYAAAEMAFKHMELQSQSQSLLVSGESGAGKTETNKQLMDYLIWRAGTDKAKASKTRTLRSMIHGHQPGAGGLRQRQRTRRNKNSSRFGKVRQPQVQPRSAGHGRRDPHVPPREVARHLHQSRGRDGRTTSSIRSSVAPRTGRQ